jgi:hypothetical protein
VPVAAREVLCELSRSGLLLKQDKCLPSVVTLLVGEPLRKSWWSHPESHRIFHVLTQLAHHPDVLFTKLLCGRDTLVHRTLWPAFIAVATSAEPWQRQDLSMAARRLLQHTRRANAPVISVGAPVRELASRLLVHTAELHMAGGAHRLAVQTWSSWAAGAGVAPLRSLAAARQQLESACSRLGAPLTALPWHTKLRSRSRGRAPSRRGSAVG